MRYRRYKRNNRRSRRTLSTKNIYNRRSAKSQANQIYALRKRISAVARANRPETYIKYATHQRVFTNSSIDRTYEGYGVYPLKSAINGNVAKMYNLIFRGNFEYADNYDLYPAIDHQRTCSMRIIVVQTKATTSSFGTNDILDLGSSGVSYELNAYKPFKSGVTSRFKILYDKIYTLSNQLPIRQFNINIRNIGNVIYEMSTEVDEGSTVATSTPVPKGAISVFIVSSGLHWDSTYSQQVTMNSFIKYAYSDA